MAKETILSIVGLDCPNCAAKVERKIGEMPEIIEATIDFLGEKLFITTEEENRNLALNAGFKRVESTFKWGYFMSFIAFK